MPSSATRRLPMIRSGFEATSSPRETLSRRRRDPVIAAYSQKGVELLAACLRANRAPLTLTRGGGGSVGVGGVPRVAKGEDAVDVGGRGVETGVAVGGDVGGDGGHLGEVDPIDRALDVEARLVGGVVGPGEVDLARRGG